MIKPITDSALVRTPFVGRFAPERALITPRKGNSKPFIAPKGGDGDDGGGGTGGRIEVEVIDCATSEKWILFLDGELRTKPSWTNDDKVLIYSGCPNTDNGGSI